MVYNSFQPVQVQQHKFTRVYANEMKWMVRHWPIGLLHDFYTALDPTKSPTSSSPAHDPDPGAPQLPWTITLRFSSYPHDLLPTLTPISTHDTFINTVKEADFARNGTAKAVMTLSPGDSRQLFTSLQDHDYDAFWKVKEKLLSANAGVKNVPVRVYNPETGQVVQGCLSVRQGNTASKTA